MFSRLRRRGLPSAAALLGGAFITASAATASAQAVVETKFPAERFVLGSDRGGILDVESARTLEPLDYDVGIWLGYADDPITLNQNGERIASLVSSRVGGALITTLGVIERLQISVNLPVVLSQDQDVGGLVGPPASITGAGVGDIRLLPKFQLLRGAFDVAIAVGIDLPTSTSDDYFGNDGVAIAPQLLLGYNAGDLRLAFNAGYLARKQRTLLDLDVDDELFFRGGIGYQVTPAVQLMGTFTYGTLAKDPLKPYNSNASEAKLGVGYNLTSSWQVFGAGGVGTSQGFGTPDWRALAGLWFGGVPDWGTPSKPAHEGPAKVIESDRDRDGLLDGVDKCPDDPELFNDFEDDDGCPEKDTDGDGFLDQKDGCPTEAENRNGIEDDDGCPEVDTDGDGIFDRQDKCPTVPEDKDGFQDDDGCPELDNDNDGVTDAADGCPLVAGPVENRGCPDTDKDGDGVVDRLDNCPTEPGDQRNQGCKAPQKVVITASGLEITDSVYFKLDKAIIEKRSFGLLDNVASVILNHPEVAVIMVEGHTDDQGNDAHNLDLSGRRAAAVMAYLVKRGVPLARLQSRGYGETRPIQPNTTKPGRAANRRVEFKIVDANGQINDARTGPGADTMEK